MIWLLIKFVMSVISLWVASHIFTIEPVDLGSIAFASLFVLLSAALWIDYTTPQDSQNLSAIRRNLSKIAILGIVIFLTIVFIHAFLSSETRLNSRIFVEIITALLKAL